MRKCKICQVDKPLDCENYRSFTKNQNIYFRHECRRCNSRRSSSYKKANPDKVKKTQLKWKNNNPNYMREYRDKNRNKIKEYTKYYESKPIIKLRKRISRSINRYLRNPKGKQSILLFLPYSIDELKQHLESQFESWMKWNNWGIYTKDKWNDNDLSTWTWQIDHIKPHSQFVYYEMSDDQFKECWALSNLRPLSAKQNLIKGAIW